MLLFDESNNNTMSNKNVSVLDAIKMRKDKCFAG